MPLLRYFVFVGGALLALLFVSGYYFPQEPIVTAADSGIDKSTIRIHSDRKWPERVVFDTNRPTIVPAAPANTIASAQVPAAAGEAASAQARVRDSFAQAQPPEQKQAQLTEPKKREKPMSRKRTIAKRHVAPPVMMVAQQPQFSLFGDSTW